MAVSVSIAMLVKDGERRYAYREVEDSIVGLHQDVLGVKDGLLIDPRNGNGLDNTRGNLRYATKAQNRANVTKAKPQGSSSKYRGVTMLVLRQTIRLSTWAPLTLRRMLPGPTTRRPANTSGSLRS